ncbi:MAG: aminotransferase class III-fold pyridoxal phosphate-dependent enzyme, partial [Dehalococcoidia bacterium]|nr:aminotransferase class III-fold pyridoxal phosphate-dependent enzyme [Dehalococcoidia bacterium]
MKSNIQYDTTDLWQKDRDHTIHGWCDFANFRETGSEIMVEGQGAYVFDSDGKRYLDGIGGVWCVNIGYGRDEMVEAIADQARRLAYANPFLATTTPPAA